MQPKRLRAMSLDIVMPTPRLALSEQQELMQNSFLSNSKHILPSKSESAQHFISNLMRTSLPKFLSVIIALMLTLSSFSQILPPATALKFDPSLGINDFSRLNYVSINDPFEAYQKEITVEFWMYTTNANLPFGSVMGQADNNSSNNTVWLMHPNRNGTMTFFVSDAGTLKTTTANISANAWHHYAAVASAGSIKFYVDGVLVNTGTSGISNSILVSSTSVIHIGKDVRFATRHIANGDPDNRYATMTMDELRIWSRALCQEEIIANKDKEINPSGQNGLQHYYRFNQGTAFGNNTTITTLNDLSGNNRNGTLNNFTLSGTESNWVTSGATNTGIVNAFVPPTAPITGTTTIGIGASTTLSNSISGGTWTSSNTAIATVNANSGLVNAISSGTSTITYKTACGGVSTANFTVSSPATALKADGVDDYVAVSNPFTAFGKAITVEFWMNAPSKFMPYGSVMGQSTSGSDNMSTNVWLMHPNTTGGIDFLVNDAGTWRAVTVPIREGGWHHYVGVASEFGTKFYVDGVLEQSGPGVSTGIVNNTSSILHIAKDPRHNAGRFGNLYIDEVRIWSRVLCAEEINNNKNCELNLTGQNGLQEYYRFNQGFIDANNSSVTTLTDLSGNNRNGTLIGFGLTGNNSNWVQSGFVSTTTCTPYVAPISPITGNTTICTAANSTLANATTGGLWSSSNTAVATVNANTGVVTGVSAGTATITYRTECGGVANTTVTIGDVVKPTITCPSNQTLNLDATCKATVPDYRSLVTVSDNCTATGSLVITQSPAAGTVVTGKGNLIVTFTVTDAAGNSNNCTFTVAKRDVTAPVITCTAPIIVNATANTCGAVVTFTSPTATDNCGGIPFTNFRGGEPNQFLGALQDYVQMYSDGTWDDLQNSVLSKWIVEFNTIITTSFAGYTRIGEFGGHTYYVSISTATWTSARAAAQSIGGDLVSINTSAENSFVASSGNAWVGGYHDTSDPKYIEPGNGSQNYGGWKWVDGTSMSTPIITITQTAGLASGSVFPVGVTTNTFKAVDESGNESTCSFTVTVRDVQNPTITCPANITVTATGPSGAVVNYTAPVGTDNCPGATTVRTAGLASGSTFPLGTTTVTHSVTDASGNQVSCSFTVTVSGLAPQIVSPGNQTASAAPGTCAAVVNFAATETTGVPASTITYSIAPGSSFAVGTTTVTATATNIIGSSSVTFTVTVTDNEKPTITCPANQTLNLDATCKATVPDYRSLVTANDNCTPANQLVITQSPAAGTVVEGRGGFFVTITVTDASNNSITCTIPVDKIDVTKPVLNYPAPITVNNTPNTCGAIVNYSLPTATDNCSGPAFNFWNTGSGEPNNANVAGEDYIELMANGKWNDLPNSSPLRSIVEFNDVRINTYTGYTRMGVFEGHTYYLSTAGATWQNSRTAAQGLGADMVSINTIAENEFLYQYLASNGGGVAWTGGYQDRTDPEYAEPGNPSQNYGGWKWVDGTRLGASQVTIVQIAGLPSGSVFPFGATVNTFRATDQSGNSIECSFTVTVRDNQPPVVTCTAPIVVNATTNTCGAVVTFTSPTAMDNCGGIPFTNFRGGEPNQFLGALQDYVQMYSDGTWDDLQNSVLSKWIVEFNTIITTSFPGYTRIGEFGGHTYYVSTGTATWTDARASARSIGGDLVSINTSAENSFVAPSGNAWVGGFHDTSDPKYIEPGNGSQNYGGWKWVDGTSMSRQIITITQTAGLASGSVFPVGVTTNTFKAVDESGNESTCSFTVTVRDVQNPVIVCPANINVTATSPSGAVVNYTAPVGTDNCPGATTVRTAGLASGSTFPLGTTTVTHSVTDASGNQVSCSFTVTVSGLAPQIVSPGNQTASAAPGTCAAVVNFAASETTGVPASTITYSIAPGSSFAVGTTTVTATATNIIGSSSVTFTVTVTDNEKPTITCPANQTLDLDASCKATLPDYRSLVTAGDNCTPANALVITQSPAAGTIVNDKGDLIVTFTVTDASGNSNTCTITVTKKDVTAPVMNCLAPIVVNNTPNICGAVVNFINPTATDNCSGGAFNFWSGGEPNNYLGLNEDYVQLYTNGTWNDLPNSSLNRSIVEFNDIRSNTYSGYTLIGTYGGHTYYISTGSATWTSSRSSAQAIGGDLASINTLGESTYLAPYGGNTWVGGYQDKTVPGFQEPGNAANNYLGWKWVDGTQLGGGLITITQTAGLPSGSVFPVGVTTNTFTATDESGNISTCSFTVTVNDVQPPVISCPANINAVATSADGAVVNYTAPVGTDNCPGATTVRTAGPASGSTFPIGTTTVTYTATDAAGNTRSCSFTVTVVGVPPVINCPSNITVNAAAGQCTANVNFAATETVGIPASTITYTINGTPVVSGASFPVGTTTVVATATNAVGSSTCSFTVTVVDNQNPTITAPAAVSGNNTPGLCTGTVTLGTPVTADNCGVASVESDAPTTFPVGTTTVTWTVTDIHGNTATATQTVTITDNEKPTITAPAAVSGSNTPGLCTGTVTLGTLVTADNCGVASVDNDAPATFPVGTTTVTWTVTDIHGNTATATQTVTITDNEKPTITAPAAVSGNNTPGLCTGTVTLGTPVTADNCGVASVDSDAPATFPVGTTTVTWTVTDIHGNTATATQTVTITDNEKPTITAPAAVSGNNTPGLCTGTVILGTPVTADNCGVASVDSDAPATFPVGTTTVTWTVTDIHGNTATATQTVTITDNEKPTISTSNINVNNDPAKCGATVVITQPTTGDNCGVLAVMGVRSDNELLTADYPVGTTTITWTVRDINGNTNSTVQTIVVTDNEKPVIACAANQVFCANTGGNTQYTIPALNQSDNCGIASTTYVVTGATNRSGTGTNASGSFAIGTSTVIYTVTDIHGNVSTCSFTVTINPLPVAGINIQSPDVLCNQFTLTGTSTLNGPFGYQWLYNNNTKSSTQQLSLGLTDADGIYTLFVTDGNVCRSEFGATYNYQKQNLSSSYTLLAKKEVKLGHYNTVESGSVGVMTAKGEADFKKYTSVNGAGSFVKAPRIDADKGSIINSKIYGVATVTLPTMQYNTSSTRYLRDISVNQNTTVTLTGNYDDVTIKKGANATLTGTIFGKVRLEEGASVKFTSAVVNMEELQIDRGPKSGGYSYVRFTQSTNVLVNGKVSIGNDVIVNPEAYVVTFFMGDKCEDGDNFHVKGDDTRITANIYIPNGKIKVTGGNHGGYSGSVKYGYGNDDDDDDSDRCDHRSHSSKDCKHKGHGHHDCDHRSHHERDCRDYVYMTGMFIAEEIHSEGKYVIWNGFNCSAPSTPSTAVTSSNNTAIATDEIVKTTNALKVVTSDEDLKVTVMPNPSPTYFTIRLESKYDAPVNMRVIDALGRVVDNRMKLGSNATVQVGHSYQTGTYFAEFIQGNRRRVVQLLKIKR